MVCLKTLDLVCCFLDEIICKYNMNSLLKECILYMQSCNWCRRKYLIVFGTNFLQSLLCKMNWEPKSHFTIDRSVWKLFVERNIQTLFHFDLATN